MTEEKDPPTRTKSIKVYVFDSEKKTIEEKAAATGVTASEYLRSCGLRRTLAVKPPLDLVTIRASAGTLKSELMMLMHLVKETNNEQIFNQVEIGYTARIQGCIALVDQTIAAAFNMKLEGGETISQ